MKFGEGFESEGGVFGGWRVLLGGDDLAEEFDSLGLELLFDSNSGSNYVEERENDKNKKGIRGAVLIQGLDEIDHS